MKTVSTLVPRAFLVVSLVLGGTVHARPLWVEVRARLEVAEVTSPGSGGVEAWSLVAVRADPERFEVVVLAAGPGEGSGGMTAEDWAREHDLVLVANAGMYEEDERTPVGYVRSHGRRVGRSWRKDYGAALVAGPGERGRAALLDASCDGPLAAAARGYAQVLQGMRLLTCRGENTFRPGGRRAVRLAVGVDGEGRLLFVFHRTPVTGYDFVEHVRAAGLDARRLMYLEGGSEARLFVREEAGEVRAGGLGSNAFWRWAGLPGGDPLVIPNVLGLRLRPSRP